MTTRGGVNKSGKRPRFKFIAETIGELRKVTWLTRREAAYLTGLVLLVALIAGIVFGLLDYGFTRLIDELFLAG